MLARAFMHVIQLTPIGLLPLLCGCVATSSMWENATTASFSSPMIIGYLDAPSGGHEWVVEYSFVRSHRLISVPVDANWQPKAPFNYVGTERLPQELVATIPSTQRQVILDYQFEIHDEPWRQTLAYANPNSTKPAAPACTGK